MIYSRLSNSSRYMITRFRFRTRELNQSSYRRFKIIRIRNVDIHQGSWVVRQRLLP
jgi:hypothetical protein